MANRADEILRRLPEELIYEKYLGGQQVSLKKHVKSPFRKDPVPSLSFIKSRNSGLLLWRDWGDAIQTSPQWVFAFVMRYYNCSLSEALDYIENDFMLGQAPSRVILSKHNLQEKKKSKKVISFNKKPLSLVDKRFWNGYGISIVTLNKYKVIPVKDVFLDGTFIKRSTSNRPIYAFDIRHKGEIYYKIYDPLTNDKRYKWLFNGSQDALLGFDQLPSTGNYVIMTKSLKDVMSLYEYGIPSFSLQSENIILDKELYTKLKARFEKVILFYDNDEAGKRGSSIMSNAFMLDQIFIPDKYQVKDISDFIKSYGKDEGEKLMKELMNHIIL